MARVNLRYVDTFVSEPNTFSLLRDGFTIRACVREAESGKHVVELPLRYRVRVEGLHIRPFDSETVSWLVESSVPHPDLARMELVLIDVPAHIADALLEL